MDSRLNAFRTSVPSTPRQTIDSAAGFGGRTRKVATDRDFQNGRKTDSHSADSRFYSKAAHLHLSSLGGASLDSPRRCASSRQRFALVLRRFPPALACGRRGCVLRVRFRAAYCFLAGQPFLRFAALGYTPTLATWRKHSIREPPCDCPLKV